MHKRTLPTQTLNKRGRDVTVEAAHTFDGNTHGILVRATHAGHVYAEVLTVGAVDGKRLENYGAEQLQADLDAHRHKVADECAWRHEINETIAQVN
jgi:hypothetical protein